MSKKSVPIIAIAAAVLFWAGAGNAQTHPTVKWLMDEPMSAFDWGVYRLDQRVHALKDVPAFDGKFMGGGASYDSAEGRLKINVVVLDEPTQKSCTRWFLATKIALSGYKWTFKEQVDAAPDVFSALFSHAGGYKAKSQPNSVGADMARLADIDVIINVKTADGYAQKARCTGTFYSEAIKPVAVPSF